MEYSGTSRVREVSVCPRDPGCPVVGGRFGYWGWDNEGTFRLPPGAAAIVLNATWDAGTPDLETLEVFLYSGHIGDRTTYATVDGASPLSAHLPVDDLGIPPGVPLKVGFTGDGPATVMVDHEIQWTATVLTG